jgi:hypothetical protein
LKQQAKEQRVRFTSQSDLRAGSPPMLCLGSRLAAIGTSFRLSTSFTSRYIPPVTGTSEHRGKAHLPGICGDHLQESGAHPVIIK